MADDGDGTHLAHPFDNEVRRHPSYEQGQHTQHRKFPAEHKAGEEDDTPVDIEKGLTQRVAGFVVQNPRRDDGTAEVAAVAEYNPHPEAEKQPP